MVDSTVHRTISITLIVKDDRQGTAEKRVNEVLNSWFHEDREAAPPYEPGALLWWGMSVGRAFSNDNFPNLIEKAAQVTKRDTTNIARERAYGFAVPSTKRPAYHIYKDRYTEPYDPDLGIAWCGTSLIQYVPEEPSTGDMCTHCLTRVTASLPEEMKRELPKNYEVWKENPHGTNWELKEAKDQGPTAADIDRYYARYVSAEDYWADYFYFNGSWSLGAN